MDTVRCHQNRNACQLRRSEQVDLSHFNRGKAISLRAADAYAGSRIGIQIRNILNSANPDVTRPSRYGLWTQITRYGLASGGHLSSQVAEQIGGSASGGMSHVVKGTGACC